MSRLCAKCCSRRRVITRAFFVPQLDPVLPNSTLALRIKYACLHMSWHLSCYEHKWERTNYIFKCSCQIDPNPIETCHSCLHLSWSCCALELIVPTCHIQRKPFPTKRVKSGSMCCAYLFDGYFHDGCNKMPEYRKIKKNTGQAQRFPPVLSFLRNPVATAPMD